MAVAWCVAILLYASACAAAPLRAMVAEGGVYALLGPYAVSAASKELRIRSSRLVATHQAPRYRNACKAQYQARG